MAHKPFKYDGCTMFPFLRWVDREAAEICCLEHDEDYFSWVQRAKDEGWSKERIDTARAKSDERLHRCVKKGVSGPHPVLAPTMWVGARMFGWVLWRAHEENLRENVRRARSKRA